MTIAIEPRPDTYEALVDLWGNSRPPHEVGGVRRAFYAGFHGPNLGEALNIPPGPQLVQAMQRDMDLESDANSRGLEVVGALLTEEEAVMYEKDYEPDPLVIENGKGQ